MKPPPTEASRLSKLSKTATPEVVMILSASAEEHRRPRLEPTTNMVDVPLDYGCPERSVRIENTLDPSIKEAIVCLLKQYQDVFTFERRKF